MITKQKKFIPITPFESIVALVMSKNTSSRDKRANYLEHAGQKQRKIQGSGSFSTFLIIF